MKLSLPEKSGQDILNSFSNLNPKDVGTWPLIPRVAALLGIFIVVITLGVFLFLKGGYDEWMGKIEEEVSLKDEFIKKKTQATNLDAYKEQLTQIDRSFGVLLKQLPSKAEIEALLIEVNQSGMGRGLSFELFKPNAENVREFYAELPINIKLTGRYHDFGAFADDIARLPRIVTLNNITIDSRPGPAGALLELNAIAKTFRYLDDAERAAAAAQGGRRR